MYFIQPMTYIGTEAVHAFIQPRHNRFHWHGMIGGVEDDENALTAAYEFLAVNLPYDDPVNGMPRLTLSVKITSGGKATFTMVYGLPIRFYGNQTTGLIAEVRTSAVQMNWVYDATGTALTWPAFRSITVPTWQLSVLTLLDTTSPLSPTLIGLAGHTNNAPFTISGVAWPTNTLRYDGTDEKVAINDVGSKYEVTYKFSYMGNIDAVNSGWLESSYDGSNTAQVENIYTEVTFDSAYFPLGDY